MKLLQSVFFQERHKRHKKILTLVKGQKLRLAVAMLCMLLMASTDLAQAYIVRPLFDDIFINKNKSVLNYLPAIVILIYLLRSVAFYGEGYYMEFVGQNIIRQLRNKLYFRLTSLPLSFFQQEKTKSD